jgi:hypothetical protein
MRNYLSQYRKFFLLGTMLVFMFALGVMPSFASTTFDLELDLQPFFNHLENFIPMFMGALAVIFAIPAAMKFVTWILSKLTQALSGMGS